MFGSFMNVFFVPLLKVDCVVITDLLDEKVLVGGAFAEKYDVSTDLRKMGINEWRGRARDREVLRRIGMEAKAHPGL
jgi:hypothetical protein